MTTVNSALPQSLLDQINGSSKSKDQSSAEGIQNRFLKLLTAQLKYQDPANPMDNFQITSQMAQISSVTGMEKMNQTMNVLLQSQFSNQSMMAAGMIGRQVMTDGNRLTHGGSGAKGAVELASPADKVTVTVVDKAGTTVKVINVEKPKLGVNHFGWDGTDVNGNKVADGEYSFKVEATSGGKAVKSTALAYSQVKGVTWESGIPKLMLDTGKTTTLADVVQIV